jgi:hypothetical protein
LLQDIEKSLSQSVSSFKCPGPEGHFPDPLKCDVYYQAEFFSPRGFHNSWAYVHIQ